MTKVEDYENLIISKVKDLDISIIVNNVGLNVLHEFKKNPLEEVMSTTKVNLYPQTMLSTIFLPLLADRAQKKGLKSAIINMSSQSAMTYMPGSSLYAAQKKFNMHLAQSL